ncbi:MAG: SPOR domain-containing protein [Burkholderiaceae bacterium]|jgi:DedD protein|nr:SPOR domain-containing protein [Burkholderiaceae bacterium]
MRWAFWRKGDSAPPAGRSSRTVERASDDADPGRADPAQALRVRARRRLIGAAALLLAAVIVVPMVLDPAPRPLPDTVPIDIPSEKTPFNPRLPLPPVPDPAQGAAPLEGGDAGKADGSAKPAVSPVTESGKDAGAASVPGKDAEKAPAKPAETAASKTPDKVAGEAMKDAAKSSDAQRARDILEGKSSTPAAKASADGKFFVQAAAPRSESAAGELAARLKKSGLPAFTERVQASDGTRWRVRVGPYATRAEAERARTRLRELGTGADLIVP